MRQRTLALLLLFIIAPSALLAEKKAPPALDAAAYPARDEHPQEHVLIAADPFDTRSRADFFRVDYVGHSLLPVRVVIRNDSDQPLDLHDVRIQFITSDNQKLPAAYAEEMDRRLFKIKDAQAKHIPGVPGVTYHSKPVDKKITEDLKDFGINATTVAPHSTLSGFLFYDTQDLDDPILKGAELYIKQIKTSEGKQLFAFSIPFDKYLAVKDAAAAKQREAEAKANADAQEKADKDASKKDKQ